MLTIEEIEKLNDEELTKFCGVSYAKDTKGKEIKVITYPKPEEYEMSEEQIQCFARYIYDNMDKVHKYIKDHEDEYKKWVEENNKM